MPAFKPIPVSDFRHKVDFYELSSSQNAFGGASATTTELGSTWCKVEEPKTTLSYNDLLSLQAGANLLQRDISIVIRFRTGFEVKKNMRFRVQGKYYEVSSFADMGEPKRYTRIVGQLEE